MHWIGDLCYLCGGASSIPSLGIKDPILGQVWPGFHPGTETSMWCECGKGKKKKSHGLWKDLRLPYTKEDYRLCRRVLLSSKPFE